MATGKISKRTIDSLPVGPKENYLWDTDLKGFGVKITAAGSISYIIQFEWADEKRRPVVSRSDHMDRPGHRLLHAWRLSDCW